MAKYGKAASKRVESAMRRKKKGTLKSGSGRKVTSRKQAIAIALSEAREKGAKVPARGSRSSGKKKSSYAIAIRLCCTKASRSALILSLWVEHMPCGRPG